MDLFLISGYCLSKLKNSKFSNVLTYLLILYFFVSVVITGERSNTIKAIFGITLFILILDNFKIKNKILFFCIFIIFNSFSCIQFKLLKKQVCRSIILLSPRKRLQNY